MFRIQIQDPGSGAFLTPGSGIGFFRTPDLGSPIPNPFLESLVTINFLGKKFYNSLKIGPNFILQHFKNKKFLNFVKFVATIKGMTTNFFSPLSFDAVFGSGIWDPRYGIWDPGSEIWGPRSGIRDLGSEIQNPRSGMGKNQDLGYGINIPDLQHCYYHSKKWSNPSPPPLILPTLSSKEMMKCFGSLSLSVIFCLRFLWCTHQFHCV